MTEVAAVAHCHVGQHLLMGVYTNAQTQLPAVRHGRGGAVPEDRRHHHGDRGVARTISSRTTSTTPRRWRTSRRRSPGNFLTCCSNFTETGHPGDRTPVPGRREHRTAGGPSHRTSRHPIVGSTVTRQGRTRHQARVHRPRSLRTDRRAGGAAHRRPGHRTSDTPRGRRPPHPAGPRCGSGHDHPRQPHRDRRRRRDRLRARRRRRRGPLTARPDRPGPPRGPHAGSLVRLDGARDRVRGPGRHSGDHRRALGLAIGDVLVLAAVRRYRIARRALMA